MRLLPVLPADKANHVLYGAVIFVLVGVLVARSSQASVARFWAAGAVAAVALGKEAWDGWQARRALDAGREPAHRREGLDALATIAGGALCWVAAAWTD